MSKLVIQHDLSKLSPEQLEQYKRDVSEFIGLDPDLNGLDTIWMDNETGPGKSLVLYARRGTAEILREINGIEVSALDIAINASGAIVYKATGKNKKGRQEIAVGSKDLTGLHGKALDDSIMTASTRALRRLTMQFTKLGILDESEVKGVEGSTVNPAAAATLAGTPMVIPPMPKLANNAPGKDVTPPAEKPCEVLGASLTPPVELDQFAFAKQQREMRAEAVRQLNIKAAEKEAEAAKQVATAPAPAAPSEETKPATEPAKPARPKRTRKSKNTVALDVEPETVSAPVETTPQQELAAVEAFLSPTPAPEANSPATQKANDTPVEGMPTKEQMGEYRKRIGVFTAELPSSENMGSVQKMRAFITKMSGTAPQFMTVDQWEETLGWFDAFVSKNATKGLVKYINDCLGVK
jgi:hypothetical protein